MLEDILDSLQPAGVLVIGIREKIPDGSAGVTLWTYARAIYRKMV